MADLSWSEQAVFDIERLLSDIERTSPAFATVLGDEIRDSAEALRVFPLLGSVVPEYGREDIRERQVRSWRLLYRVEGEVIELLTFVSVNRRLPRTPPG